jgi:Spx/MgsR family transcriptional regulator
MITLYGIKNCDTVRKARRWLDANSVDFQFHDFRADGLDETTINTWLKTISWEILLNKRGTTWRKLEDPRKDQLDQATAIELILENPTLIKRPILIRGEKISVGFSETKYTEIFS